jgi:ParB-like nuclease domain
MSAVIPIAKPKTGPERKTRTVVDTILVTPDLVKKWKSPGFQRPVQENQKVRDLAESLKTDGGCWPGIVTLGILNGETYIVDGQHRKAAFLISGLEEGYTDVRTHYFESMADMGEEFVQLNSQLVRMRPDDILRGLEESSPAMIAIRARCPYVGYDMVRRGDKAPLLSMSTVLRWWRGSVNETPANSVSGLSTAQLAQIMTEQDTEQLCDFLDLALSAFGRDPEYVRLWSGLNLMLCMWLYRRLVLSPHSHKTKKMSKDQFKRCLMSVSAQTDYLDWLLGRKLCERDRSPAYAKIKAAMAQRIFADTGVKAMLPQPPWQYGTGGHGK